MPSFQADAYSPIVAALLKNAKCNDLGPGASDNSLRDRLMDLTPQSVVGDSPLRDRDMALACCAALWLRHDFLDESHHISQSIETPAGSYWHAILHRREPDYGNSKYWFRRVGRHSVFDPLNTIARQLAREAKAGKPADDLIDQPSWDPFRFVDLCEYAIADPASVRQLCQKIQQSEWELLFDDCYRQAIDGVGPPSHERSVPKGRVDSSRPNG